MRLKLISCEVLYREMCAAVARSPHQVDIQFLPKGLHDLGGDAMRLRLQELIDGVEAAHDALGYDAVLLGYGLCGNGGAGLTARAVPLVIPRAHDCIALLMGSRALYQQYFDTHPGVYFRSTGWLERGEDLSQEAMSHTLAHIGTGQRLEDMIARYGEDNGRYLFEQLNGYQQHYSHLTFISTGVEPNQSFEQRAREEAARRGWHFDSVTGNLGIFERLVSGNWDESEFLVVPPGWRTVARYDAGIIDKEPLP